MLYMKMTGVLIWMAISGILGLILTLLRPGNLDNDKIFARIFSWGACRISGIRVVTEGLENLTAHQPCIYVVNHQGALDLMTFGCMYPRQTIVIGKRELLLIPVFGIFFVAAGNVIINRQKRESAVASLGGAVEVIRKKRASIWIFPEGTRNRTDQPMLPFKKGAFHMAIQAGVPIVPVVSSSLRSIAHWRERRLVGGTVRIRVLPPISTQGMTEEQVDALSDQARANMLEAIRSLAGK